MVHSEGTYSISLLLYCTIPVNHVITWHVQSCTQSHWGLILYICAVWHTVYLSSVIQLPTLQLKPSAVSTINIRFSIYIGTDCVRLNFFS